MKRTHKQPRIFQSSAPESSGEPTLQYIHTMLTYHERDRHMWSVCVCVAGGVADQEILTMTAGVLAGKQKMPIL